MYGLHSLSFTCIPGLTLPILQINICHKCCYFPDKNIHHSDLLLTPACHVCMFVMFGCMSCHVPRITWRIATISMVTWNNFRSLRFFQKYYICIYLYIYIPANRDVRRPWNAPPTRFRALFAGPSFGFWTLFFCSFCRIACFCTYLTRTHTQT